MLLNGGKMPPKVNIVEPEPNSKPTNRLKRAKSRDHPNGMKPRLKKLSTNRLNACSVMSEQLSPSAINGFPPTPLESSAFVMPSPKENFFPGHNGMAQAPLLTPPVSPAITSGLSRNVLGNNLLSQVTYTALGEKKQQAWGYSTNGDLNPSSDVIDSLVAQHFNNCGLGGFVAPTRYQTLMTNGSSYINNVSAMQFYVGIVQGHLANKFNFYRQISNKNQEIYTFTYSTLKISPFSTGLWWNYKVTSSRRQYEITPLVELYIGNAEVIASNPIQVWNFQAVILLLLTAPILSTVHCWSMLRGFTWPGARFSQVPKSHLWNCYNRLFLRADLLTCFQDLNPLRSWDTKEILTPRKWPVKFRDFRETGPSSQ